ncbi:hypothetical protein [Rhodococcus sp. BE178]|uniref:hypothetical protein n=1 Tax=Rhodococcus sp. BE178 TaxID=2817737 RepID=UPI003D23E7A7
MTSPHGRLGGTRSRQEELMTNTNPIVGYVVLAKRKLIGGYDYQAVGAMWPTRNRIAETCADLQAIAERKGYDIEYIIGEIRGCA